MDIKALFTTVWQEDNEIAFIQLAQEGIPTDFKTDGIPDDKPQVRDYLGRLVSLNKPALMNVTDRFLEVIS